MAKEKGEGAWIFVSHSHKDLEKVRFIRNEFEKRGHNPLLFFLKCLNDESELDNLIKREIAERNWFILCDSPNARDSKWVQEEVKMIKSLEGKVFKTINLEDDIEKQINVITKFSKRSTVFISHTSKDAKIGQKLISTLKKHDFGVFDYNEGIQTPKDWKKTIRNAIDDAIAQGFVVFLISKNTFESKYAIEEIAYALEKNALVVPVLIEEKGLDTLFHSDLFKIDNKGKYVLDRLKYIQFFQLDHSNIDESIEKLVLELKFWDEKGEG